MMKTFLHMIAGGVAAYCLVSVWDFVGNVRASAALAELQTALPSDWLAVNDFHVLDAAQSGIEPVAHFELIPTRELLMRITVSSRDATTGESLCSGGTETKPLAMEPAMVDLPISQLAGVEKCLWPVGRYKTRLTWTIIEPKTQIEKRIVLESNEFSVP